MRSSFISIICETIQNVKYNFKRSVSKYLVCYLDKQLQSTLKLLWNLSAKCPI